MRFTAEHEAFRAMVRRFVTEELGRLVRELPAKCEPRVPFSARGTHTSVDPTRAGR